MGYPAISGHSMGLSPFTMDLVALSSVGSFIESGKNEFESLICGSTIQSLVSLAPISIVSNIILWEVQQCCTINCFIGAIVRLLKPFACGL